MPKARAFPLKPILSPALSKQPIAHTARDAAQTYFCTVPSRSCIAFRCVLTDIVKYSRPHSFRKQDLSSRCHLLYKRLAESNFDRTGNNFPPVVAVNPERESRRDWLCLRLLSTLGSPFHRPAFHHEIHLLHKRDVVQWIARHRHYIRQLARFNRSQRIFFAQ
jgi:hypothetical protein